MTLFMMEKILSTGLDIIILVEKGEGVNSW